VKITQLNEDPEELWEDFFRFCVESKPYDYHKIPSFRLKKAKIRKNFDDLVESCQIFLASKDEKKVVVLFLKPYIDFVDVEFIFGFSRNFNSKVLIEGVHRVFDKASFINNKKYFKSEIRRKFKVASYKKWIERYDKTAIIFNDEHNSIVWCKLQKMKVKFEVVGSNSAMSHLINQSGHLGKTFDSDLKSQTMREIFFNEERYLLDEKKIEFNSQYALVHGFLSDTKEKVGRVVLKFLPQNETE
jgi:hypothetical protein|tara:strand:- start:1738 stop:2469 length:732 start_codon:yes stop_codon:yes gene_type:complete